MPGDAWWRPRRAKGAGGARGAAVPAVAALAALVPLVVACGHDGRSLSQPAPEQTTSTAPATTAPPAGSEAGEGVDAGSESAVTDTAVAEEPLRLTSPVIVESGEIPDTYTCWGRELSPPLQWGPVPADTVELALVVRDVDAGGFVHWVVAGIEPATGGVAEGRPPAGAVEARNDFGRDGWAGPCPPDGVHNYEFRVYALAEPSGVTADMPGADAAARVEATPARMSAVLSGSAEPAPVR
jgi:Raf kinase inhibitor-like YbhB/YbcL family protein